MGFSIDAEMAIDDKGFGSSIDRTDLLRLILHGQRADADPRICSLPVGDVDSQV